MSKIQIDPTQEAQVVKAGDKEVMVICLPMQEPTPSKSGKSLTVATTNGNRATALKVDDKNVTIGVNAYIPNR